MVSGTAQNDSLQSFNSTLRKTQEQFYTRYQALSKTTPDFKEKVEALQDEMMQSFGDVYRIHARQLRRHIRIGQLVAHAHRD